MMDDGVDDDDDDNDDDDGNPEFVDTAAVPAFGGPCNWRPPAMSVQFTHVPITFP